MAYPVIRFNNSGSDTNTSGAGPDTALTGTAAATDGSGLVVTLDGSPDLSGVASDGSHVIWLDDSTASARNFAMIVGVDDTAKTVTVETAHPYTGSLSGKDWAIGGKRASLGGAGRLLYLGDGNYGDANAFWTLELESGYTETVSSVITMQLYRDQVDYSTYVEIRAAAGYSTKPVITDNQSTDNAFYLSPSCRNTHWKDIDFVYDNASDKTGSNALFYLSGSGSAHSRFENCNFGNASTGTPAYWLKANYAGSGHLLVYNCEFEASKTAAIIVLRGLRMERCIFNGGPIGLEIQIYPSDILIRYNIFNGCAVGIQPSTATTYHTSFANIENNVFYNGTNGIAGGGASVISYVLRPSSIYNNIFHTMSGDAIDTQVGCFKGWEVRNNCFYNITGDDINDTEMTAADNITTDPQFTNAGSGDFSLSSSSPCIGTGYPSSTTIGLLTSTVVGYSDMGAVTPDHSGGGGLQRIGMSGGIVQ